jgi:hypothetical protein
MSGGQFVQLEEFDESLRGRRICAYMPSAESAQHYIRLVISNAQVGGEPFTRLIAVTSDPVMRLLADSIGATTITGARDNSDLSLILTAANQASAHTLIVIFPDIGRLPDAFFNRLPAGATLIIFRNADDITTISSCNIHMMPYIKEVTVPDYNSVMRRVAALGITQYDLPAILKELRVAQAGLIIYTPGGIRYPELYWWNTGEEVPPIKRKKEVIVGLLKFITELL